MKNIRDLSLEELQQIIRLSNEPIFRAKQIYEWLQKGADGFDEMTNVPKKIKESLALSYDASLPKIIKKLVSKTDGTVKYVLSMADGECIETVLMQYKYGLSVCISSQVGCRMGCSFCASTLKGKTRDLTAGEMLGQVQTAMRDAGKRISHIVIMGIGEPFDNFDAVLSFLKLVTDEKGMNLSARNITISTCGLPGGIDKLTKEHIPVTLAISLHAPNDEIRKSMMPSAKAITIDTLLADADRYANTTGRRYTLEYALVKGVNDSKKHAVELSKRIKGRLCHVNLIPVNPVKETGLVAPDQNHEKLFYTTLKELGIAVTVRRELGRDISASCGQLRNEVIS